MSTGSQITHRNRHPTSNLPPTTLRSDASWPIGIDRPAVFRIHVPIYKTLHPSHACRRNGRSRHERSDSSPGYGPLPCQMGGVGDACSHTSLIVRRLEEFGYPLGWPCIWPQFAESGDSGLSGNSVCRDPSAPSSFCPAYPKRIEPIFEVFSAPAISSNPACRLWCRYRN